MQFIIGAALLFLLTFSTADGQVTAPNRGGTGTSTAPTTGQVLIGQPNGTYAPRATSSLGFTSGGSVTSVGLAAPTGFTVSGSPITTSGTLEFLYAAGYGPILSASSSQWHALFSDPTSRIIAGTGIDWSGTSTLNVTLAGLTTANLTEGSNLYYTDDRSRAALSEDILGLNYSSLTGVLSTTTGYAIPTTTRLVLHDEAYAWGNHASAGYITDGNAGWDNSYGFITSANVPSSNWLQTGGFLAPSTTIGLLIGAPSQFTTVTATGVTSTAATTSTLTVNTRLTLFGTTGTSLSDFCSGVTGGSGLCDGNDAIGSTLATSTTPVIGELSYWTGPSTLGTAATGTLSEAVEGLELSATRYLVGGSASVNLTSGYVISTTTREASQDTAFGWGNHALAGYLTSIATTTVRPMFTDSIPGLTYTNSTGDFSLDAGSVVPTTTRANTWDTAFGWGNHATQGYLTTVDISANTNLTADGTEIVLIGGALSLGNVLTITDYTSTRGTTTNASSTDLFSTRATITGLTNTNATSSNFRTTTLGVGSDYLTDITGAGLTITGNALAVSTSTFFTNSAQFAQWLSDETGSGNVVFSASPVHTGTAAFASFTTSGSSTLGYASSTSLTAPQFYFTNASGTAATTTQLSVGSSINLFGGGAKSSANALCIQLTGHADLCDGTDATGAGGSSNWVYQNGRLSPSTTVGLGVFSSSTFEAALNVASTSYNYLLPVFDVSTSTGPWGDLFNITATTTAAANATSTTSIVNGVRALIGTLPSFYKNSNVTSHLYVNGKTESSFWYLKCNVMTMLGGPTSDQVSTCGDAAYKEDGSTGSSALTTITLTPGVLMQALSVSNTLADTGAGLFFDAHTPRHLFASSTPTFEAVVRVPPGASSTVYVGFTNTLAVNTSYEAAPTAGAFYTASSSEANWLFSVVTSASASTTINTGIPSTTPIYAKIVVDPFFIYPFIGVTTTPMRLLSNPIENSINGTALGAGAYFGRPVFGGSGASQLVIASMELWLRKSYMWTNY